MLKAVGVFVFLSFSLVMTKLALAAAPIASVDLSSGAVSVEQVAPVPAVKVNPLQNLTPNQVLASLTPQQRLARLENQIQYLNTYGPKLDSLTATVAQLRGQIEDLNYRLQGAQQQIAALKAKLANSVPAVTPEATAAVASTSTQTVMPSQEQIDFKNATALLDKKQYQQAITAFNKFVTTYPNSSDAIKAHYLLGNLYLAVGQPDQAARAYHLVIKNTSDPHTPDALVKLGTIALAYGDNTKAKQYFQTVIQKYPNTAAAKQAKQRLEGIS